MGLLLWLPFLRACQVGSRHHIDGHAAINEGPAGQAVISEVGAALRQVRIDVVRSGLAERLPSSRPQPFAQNERSKADAELRSPVL